MEKVQEDMVYDNSADLMPRSFKSAKKALDVNWGPLSEIILFGSPNRLKRFSPVEVVLYLPK